MDITDGGFRLDVEYTPARLYELAKMDGAIIISSDLKRITACIYGIKNFRPRRFYFVVNYALFCYNNIYYNKFMDETCAAYTVNGG